MDGQNFNNEQGGATETPQNPNYQDNTAYQQVVSVPDNGAQDKANGMQVASLVLGILSILFSCCYGVPGIIMSVIGIVCAVKGNKEKKNGVGTGGLVCSIIGLILSVIMLIYVIVVGAAVFSALSDNSLWQ